MSPPQVACQIVSYVFTTWLTGATIIYRHDNDYYDCDDGRHYEDSHRVQQRGEILAGRFLGEDRYFQFDTSHTDV